MKSTIPKSDLHNRRRVHPLSLRANVALRHRFDSSRNNTPLDERDPTTLHALSKLLIDAQEQERARISRELHDGVGQELALLIVNMQCPPDVPGTSASMNKHLLQLKTQAENLATMVRTISHDLHPPELDYLGLKVALESLCRRFSSAWRIAVRFTCSHVLCTADRYVSLALYRVLQEALHNIAKHSGARTATVELVVTQAELLLRVQDTGRGFEVDQTNGGVGLVSMSERISAIGGSMKIQSRIGTGTTIEFRVPVAN